jgi:hypothetical protein
LIESLTQALSGDPTLVRARLEGRGLDPSLFDRLGRVRWVEVPGYVAATERETRRDRTEKEKAVAEAIDCDLFILVIDGRMGLQPADVAFAQAWDRHFIEQPQREAPPTLVVVMAVDHPDLGIVWAPPYDWTAGVGVREAAVRSLFESLRATLPPTFNTFTAAGLPGETPFGLTEHVVPALAAQLHRAERSALIRQLQSLSGRSKIGRVAGQLSEHGRQIWSNLRIRHKRAMPSR